MSVKLMGVCYSKQFDNHTDKDVMLALADHADDHGVCWPSQAYIAWKVDRHPDSVKAVFRKFRDKKIIEVIGRAEGGRGRSPVIQIHPEKLPDKPAYERGGTTPPVLDKGGASHDKGGVSDPPESSLESSSPNSSKDEGFRDASEASAADPAHWDARDWMIATSEDLKAVGKVIPAKRKFGHISSWGALIRREVPVLELERTKARIVSKAVEGRLLTPSEAHSDINGSGENVVNGKEKPWHSGADEPLNPHGEQAAKLKDKPMNPVWYEATYGVEADTVREWIEGGMGHRAISERLGGSP